MSESPLVLTFAGRRIGIESAAFTIGRARDNDLPVRSSNVSRKHCRVERRDDDYYMVDTGSTGGIELRGVRVRDYRIDDGDTFNLHHECALRFNFGPAPLTELHTDELKVITIELGPLALGRQISDLRWREPLPFEVRGVLLAGNKGAVVLWRDDRLGRSGLTRGAESYSWSTAAFPVLRADAAPDGIVVTLRPQRNAEPVTLLESPRSDEASWRATQDLIYTVSRLFPGGARTGDEVERSMTMSKL